jgi:hypothetical protein
MARSNNIELLLVRKLHNPPQIEVYVRDLDWGCCRTLVVISPDTDSYPTDWYKAVLGEVEYQRSQDQLAKMGVALPEW